MLQAGSLAPASPRVTRGAATAPVHSRSDALTSGSVHQEAVSAETTTHGYAPASVSIGGRVLNEEALRLRRVLHSLHLPDHCVSIVRGRNRIHKRSGELHFYIEFFLCGPGMTKAQKQRLRKKYLHNLPRGQRPITFPTIVVQEM